MYYVWLPLLVLCRRYRCICADIAVCMVYVQTLAVYMVYVQTLTVCMVYVQTLTVCMVYVQTLTVPVKDAEFYSATNSHQPPHVVTSASGLSVGAAAFSWWLILRELSNW